MSEQRKKKFESYFRIAGEEIGRTFADLSRRLEKTEFTEGMTLTKHEQHIFLDACFNNMFGKGNPKREELELRISLAYALMMSLASQLCDILQEMKIPINMEVKEEEIH